MCFPKYSFQQRCVNLSFERNCSGGRQPERVRLALYPEGSSQENHVVRVMPIQFAVAALLRGFGPERLSAIWARPFGITIVRTMRMKRPYFTPNKRTASQPHHFFDSLNCAQMSKPLRVFYGQVLELRNVALALGTQRTSCWALIP